MNKQNIFNKIWQLKYFFNFNCHKNIFFVKISNVFITVLLCLVVSCSKNTHDLTSRNKSLFYSWDVQGYIIPTINRVEKENILPKTAFPWGGTVSHHLLAGIQIEEWFSTLASVRNDIKTFFLLSPSHWKLSMYDFSLTNGMWVTKQGVVEQDIKKVKKLKKILNVPYDSNVFLYEHGVYTLTPFIKKYFPYAKIVVIAYNGEPPVNISKVNKLYKAINTVFSTKTAEKEKSFLLVSTDFSHNSDLETTLKKDSKSRKFLTTLNPNFWILSICDNRPSMYILSKLFSKETECTIQHHTNAYELTEATDPNDITSYFFTFFWENR